MRPLTRAPGAVQPDLRVHREREVERRRALRQLDDVARRREDEDLVLIQIELEELQELVGRLGVHLELEHLAEPRQVPIELVALRVFLVPPVRGDAEVRRAMHVARADLDFVQLSPGAEDRRVQRLVAVRLRLRDVVLDALLHRRPPVVDDAERVVAVGHGVDEHANGEEVVDLLVRLLALLHLLVDRPQVLRPAR